MQCSLGYLRVVEVKLMITDRNALAVWVEYMPGQAGKGNVSR